MNTTCRHPLPHSGTSQTTRLLSALSPSSVKMDAHEVEDLMVYAQALSQQVCYWNYDEVKLDHQDGNWSVFWGSDPLFLLAAIAATDLQALERQYKKAEEEALKLLTYLHDEECEIDPRPEAIRNLVNLIYQLARQMVFWGQQEPGHPALSGELSLLIAQQLPATLQTLIAYDLGTPGDLNDYSLFLQDRNEHPLAKNWGLDYLHFTQIDPLATTDADQVIDGDVILPLRDLFKKFLKVLARLRTRAKFYFAETKNGPREHQPHIALFLAFLDLFNTLQVQLNSLTAQHLDYYYGQILQIGKRQSISDQVHLVFQLAIGAVRDRLEAGTLFRAGKDAAGKDRQYVLERDLTLNQGKVAEIHTLYLKGNPPIQSAHFSSILDTDKKNAVPDKIEEVVPFYSLGHEDADLMSIGFAIASGQFETSAANRTFTVSIEYPSVIPITGTHDWNEYFSLELSTANGWLPLVFTNNEKTVPDAITKDSPFPFTSPSALLKIADSKIELKMYLDKQQPAIAPLKNKTGCCFNKELPVLKFSLKKNAFTRPLSLDTTTNVIWYEWVKKLNINKVTIEIKAQNVTDFRLEEGNTGLVLPSTQNIAVSRYLGTGLRVHSKELFSKKGSFSIPSNLKTARVINDGEILENPKFEEIVQIPTIKDYVSGLIQTAEIYNAPLVYQPSYPTKPYWGPLTGNWGTYNYTPPLLGSKINPNPLTAFSISRMVGPPSDVPTQMVSLPRGNENKSIWFDFKKPTVASGAAVQRFIDLELEYTSTQVVFQSVSDSGNNLRTDDNLDHFYYLGPNDSCWELKGWHDLDTNNQKTPFKLFPSSDKYPHFRRPEPILNTTIVANGNLFIGLEKLEPGQMASLLFQMVEGSEENYCKTPEIEWSYLSDNNWKRFPPGTVTFDSTRGDENSRRSLVQSGIVELQIPADASKNDCLIKSGFIWVRASAVEQTGESVGALPKLAAIYAQAGRAKLHNNLEIAPSHFDASLPAETINQLQIRRATARKTEQKYPGFGGRAPEAALDWYLRISERLRHKRRAITQWDYERLVLERFPEVRTVKCINHTHLVTANTGPCADLTQENDHCANGHVTVVVLPYLKDFSVQNPFTPQPSAGLLEQVTGYLRPCANMFVADLWQPNVQYLHVVRPDFQQVAVSLKVKFQPELSDTEIWKFQLDTDISRFISPWAFDEKIAPDFSRNLDRTDLLFFLENLEYVDYVTDLLVGEFGAINNQIALVFGYQDTNMTSIYSANSVIQPNHEGALLTTFIRPLDADSRLLTDLSNTNGLITLNPAGGNVSVLPKNPFLTNHLIEVIQ